MSDSETFDAFYARTAWKVTSQMHSMTGHDRDPGHEPGQGPGHDTEQSQADHNHADHAVREAYARAYQQWYEVSGYRDPEAWVLKVAEEAFERRREQAAAVGLDLGSGQKADPGTWPGIYRPRSAPRPGSAGQGPGDAEPGQAANADPAGVAISKGTWARRAMAGRRATGRGARHAAIDADDAGGAIIGGAADDAGGAIHGGGDAGAALAGDAGAALAGGAPGNRGLTESTWFGGTGSPGVDTGTTMPGGAGRTSIGARRGLLRRPNRPGVRGLNLSNASSPADLDSPGSFGTATGLSTPGTIDSRSAASHPDRPTGHSGPTGVGNLRTLGIPARLANRRMLFAGLAAVVVVAVGAYLAFGQQPVRSAGRGSRTGDQAKPAVHMLTAGQTGTRASVPWKLVGPGWTLAELSAAQPDANGAASSAGSLTLYLIDPEGGKYEMHTWTGPSVALLAWSGNAKHALLRFGSRAPGQAPLAYGVLALATGHITDLHLKADVTPVNFTRPNGLNILAIRRTATKFELRRYDLLGSFQATLSTMPDRHAAPSTQPGACASLCNALSSPDGFQAVWGVAGNEMQLVNNGGGLVHRLRVPASGTPPSCVPVSWWNATTVLANCAAPGQPSADSERLWLVPTDGTAANAVAPPSGSPSGAGFDAAAWMANGHVYLTQTSTRRCSTAASGPGGLDIQAVGPGESPTAVPVPDGTHNYDNVVGTVGSRLLVLAQTSCPGTSSLLWLSPSGGTAKMTMLLPGPAGQLGVIAAVAYRGAPTAYSLG